MKDKVRTSHKAMKTINKVMHQLPGFSDVFDEDTFYQFAFVFTMCTIVCVFLLSRYITLTSQDPLDKENKGVKRNPATTNNKAARTNKKHQQPEYYEKNE